jgi:putative endonuclease
MEVNKKTLGKYGEDLAACSVTNSGLKILVQNYRCPKGEMDIIALDKGTLVFIEVRTRRSSVRGWGEESITHQKAQRLKTIAAYYICQQGYSNWPDLRFDVIAVRWLGNSPELTWIKAAL